MKIKMFWATYSPVGKMAELFDGATTQSGTWIDAMASIIDETAEYELAIAAPYSSDKKVSHNSTTFYGLSGCKRVRGVKAAGIETGLWHKAMTDFKPDIVVLWGTEYSNGLNVIEAAKLLNKPVIIFIQGVIKAIVEHPNGDLRYSKMFSTIGFIDKVKLFFLKGRNKALSRQMKYEAEMIVLADGIICDSDWCAAQYRSIRGDLPLFNISLPVGRVFQQSSWDYKNCIKNSLFCIAGTGPHKGLHQLIEALAIVKKVVPDIQLIVPGALARKEPKWIYENPYMAYVYRLIDKYGLENNIHFCGRLTPSEMAQYMMKSNVFIMMSCIENHSSTLREAMYLGLPCISSNISSVPEFVEHGRNGLLYRYGESATLAYMIEMLLLNSNFAKELGANAYKSIRAAFPQESIRSNFADTISKLIG